MGNDLFYASKVESQKVEWLDTQISGSGAGKDIPRPLLRRGDRISPIYGRYKKKDKRGRGKRDERGETKKDEIGGFCVNLLCGLFKNAKNLHM